MKGTNSKLSFVYHVEIHMGQVIHGVALAGRCSESRSSLCMKTEGTYRNAM